MKRKVSPEAIDVERIWCEAMIAYSRSSGVARLALGALCDRCSESLVGGCETPVLLLIALRPHR